MMQPKFESLDGGLCNVAIVDLWLVALIRMLEPDYANSFELLHNPNETKQKCFEFQSVPEVKFKEIVAKYYDSDSEIGHMIPFRQIYRDTVRMLDKPLHHLPDNIKEKYINHVKLIGITPK